MEAREGARDEEKAHKIWKSRGKWMAARGLPNPQLSWAARRQCQKHTSHGLPYVFPQRSHDNAFFSVRYATRIIEIDMPQANTPPRLPPTEDMS